MVHHKQACCDSCDLYWISNMSSVIIMHAVKWIWNEIFTNDLNQLQTNLMNLSSWSKFSEYVYNFRWQFNGSRKQITVSTDWNLININKPVWSFWRWWWHRQKESTDKVSLRFWFDFDWSIIVLFRQQRPSSTR